MDDNTRLDILEQSMRETNNALGILTRELSNIGELIRGINVAIDNSFSLIKLEIDNKMNNIETNIDNQLRQVRENYVTKEEFKEQIASTKKYTFIVGFSAGFIGMFLFVIIIGVIAT